MSDDFIDSNVFVYQFDETDSARRRAADELIFRSMREGTGTISHQVVQETLNVLTGKLAGVASESHRERYFASTLLPLWKVMPSADLYRRGLALQARYGFHFYDALIVAAALTAGCKRLYSEDLQHEQRIENLVVINPFAG